MPINFESHVPSRWINNPVQKEETFASFQVTYRDLSKLQRLKNEFPDYSLDGVVDRLSRFYGLAWLYDGKELAYNYIYYLNQLRQAWFQYTTNDGQPVTLTIVNHPIETVGRFKSHRISAFDVTQGIQTALLMRDQTALNYFSDIPVDFTEQSGQDDLIVEIEMAFYQLLAKGKSTADEARAAFHTLSQQLDWNTYQRYVAVEGFNQSWVWERIFAGRKEYAEYVSLPVLNIYFQILENSQPAFEDAVRIALEKWKQYYTKVWIDENKEDCDNSLLGEGFLSLPITAACAYAYDRGLRLTSIESSYIPQWLIEGDFNGLSLRFRPENSAD